MLTRTIPSTGEQLPAIGLGTWQSFDKDESAYPVLEKVLDVYQAADARLIDSSPMYGRSEKVIGDITSQMTSRNFFFYATKVWTTGREEGIRQMNESFAKMQRTQMDLVQVHNLVDYKTHLRTLRKWKDEGRVKYIGVTHYTDDSHPELERVLREEPVDFVQFNYSLLARNAEKRLLGAAADLGVATLINRPLGEGKMFSIVRNKELPGWAPELGIDNWSAFFLKYILAHPAVTCVIPATANPAHAEDNMKAGAGRLPDEKEMKKMLEYVESL